MTGGGITFRMFFCVFKTPKMNLGAKYMRGPEGPRDRLTVFSLRLGAFAGFDIV